jgi:hypothetical protein
LRHKLLEKSRQNAIASALREIDLVGICTDGQQNGERQTALNALAWRSNSGSAIEIEQRLDSHGTDTFALNADVHIQAREFYLMFEGLIISAQHRSAMLLRDINYQRYARRVTAQPTRRRSVTALN